MPLPIKQRCISARKVVDENNVGGMPDHGGDRAAGLAGDDDFEEFGFRDELGEQRVIWIRRKRLRECEMTQDVEDDVLRRGQRSVDAGRAELQLGVSFIEMPRKAGAERRGTVETLACFFGRGHGGTCGRGRSVWVEYQENAAIVFARKFSHH